MTCMTARKRLLVITYYWPPSGGAGVQRWLKFVKYLRPFGWEPVVYTPQNPEMPVVDESLTADVPEGLEVVRTRIWEPYRWYKRFVGRRQEDRINSAFLSEGKPAGLAERMSVWLRGNAFIPDARRFWIRPSVRFLCRYLAAHPVDAMASTGPPHSMHLIALGVKRRLGLPWLADFRDPWTGIDYYRDLLLTGAADRTHHRLEKQVLREADAVVAVGRTMRQELIDLSGSSDAAAGRFHEITNGFDEADLPGSPAVPDGFFSLVHVGSLVRTRNHDALWEALASLVADEPGFRDDLKVRLVGKTDYSVTESVNRHGMGAYVERADYVPHRDVIRVMQQARVLLLLLNDTPNAGGILTGKLFEYLAAGRPVLSIGPTGGDTAAILSETGAGTTVGFRDAVGMKRVLSDLYRKFKQGNLSVTPHGTQRYNRRSLTQRLTAVLDGIAGTGPDGIENR